MLEKYTNLWDKIKQHIQTINAGKHGEYGEYGISFLEMFEDTYQNINSVNPLYVMIGKVDGYIDENNGNKYLTFASTEKNKKVLEKYTNLWDKIKQHIQTINAGKYGEYGEYGISLLEMFEDNIFCLL